MTEADLARAAERLAAATSTCILTGSGISAESGIPTFRAGALVWRDLRAMDLATPEGFARDPELVWTWYNERLAGGAAAAPNAGHRAIAELERLLPRVTLVTQNVDSLHVRAGSRAPLELHGHLREAHCDRAAASGAPSPPPVCRSRRSCTRAADAFGRASCGLVRCYQQARSRPPRARRRVRT